MSFVGRKAGLFYSVCKVVNRLFWQAFSTNYLYLSTLLLTPSSDGRFASTACSVYLKIFFVSVYF